MLSVLTTLVALPTNAAAAPVLVGRFPAAEGEVSAPWRSVVIDKKVPATRYRTRVWDGVNAVEAQAQGSMALLARSLSGEATVDLQATPVLCWRWRVEAVLQTADLKTKAGDDYAARVYVAFKLPPESLSFGLRTKLALGRSLYGELVPDAALNYVWDNTHPVGTRRPNAYTDRTQMIVQQSGNARAGSWVTERVNVLQDAVAAFGPNSYTATLLAVAADTDNTGETARSGFADLHFVPANAPCAFP